MTPATTPAPTSPEIKLLISVSQPYIYHLQLVIQKTKHQIQTYILPPDHFFFFELSSSTSEPDQPENPSALADFDSAQELPLRPRRTSLFLSGATQRTRTRRSLTRTGEGLPELKARRSWRELGDHVAVTLAMALHCSELIVQQR